MSLLRSSYRKHEDTDDEYDDVGRYAQLPERKKVKTCAPEAEEPKPTPVVPSFEPLPIIYPHIATSSAATNPSVSAIAPKRLHSNPPPSKQQNLQLSLPTWDVLSQAKFGTVFDLPDIVSSAINHTEKHGQVLSRIPKQPILKSSPNHRHNGAVFCAKWTPRTGQLLLTASADGMVKFWDPLRTASHVGELRAENGFGVRDATFSDDGRSVLFGGYGKKLYHVDIETGKILVNMPQEATIQCVEIFRGELVCGLSSGNVMSYDPRDPYMASITDPSMIGKTQKDSNGRYIRRIQTSKRPIASLLFLDDATPSLVTCSDPSDDGTLDYAVVVWDWLTGIPQSTALFSEPFPCFSLRRHPTLSQFAAQCSSSHIEVFSSTAPWKRKKKKQFNLHKLKGFPIQFDFSPDGQFLYSGSSAGQIYIYQYSNSKLVSTLPVFDATDPVIAVAHHPILKSVLAVTSWSGNVSVYQ